MAIKWKRVYDSVEGTHRVANKVLNKEDFYNRKISLPMSWAVSGERKFSITSTFQAKDDNQLVETLKRRWGLMLGDLYVHSKLEIL